MILTLPISRLQRSGRQHFLSETFHDAKRRFTSSKTTRANFSRHLPNAFGPKRLIEWVTAALPTPHGWPRYLKRTMELTPSGSSVEPILRHFHSQAKNIATRK